MKSTPSHSLPRGRSTGQNPPNRFEASAYVPDAEEAASVKKQPTQLIPDNTVSIISRNDSPDIPFNISHGKD